MSGCSGEESLVMSGEDVRKLLGERGGKQSGGESGGHFTHRLFQDHSLVRALLVSDGMCEEQGRQGPAPGLGDQVEGMHAGGESSLEEGRRSRVQGRPCGVGRTCGLS